MSIPTQPLVLLLALIDPSTTGFELLKLNIHNPEEAIVQDIIGSSDNLNSTSLIRTAAKDSRLAKLNYYTICDYHHGHVFDGDTRLIHFVSSVFS